MKIQTLVCFAMLVCLSSQVSAHMIYYADCDDSADKKSTFDDSFLNDFDVGAIPGKRLLSKFSKITKTTADELDKCVDDSPEAQALKSNIPTATGSDRAAALAFCKAGGYGDPVGCASTVLSKNLVGEAKDCMGQLADIQKNLLRNLPIAHTLAGTPAGGGVWHQDYRKSTEDTWHRHNWTKEARESAGTIFAAMQIEQAKIARETNSSTTSKSTTYGGFLGIDGKIGFGLGFSKLADRSVEGGGNAGFSGSTEKGTSVEKGPLTEKEIKEIYQKYYDQAYGNPNLVNQNADVVCYLHEKDCVTSASYRIPNDSYQPGTGSKNHDSQTPSTKKDEGTPGKKTSDNNTQPKSDDTKTQDTTISTTDHGLWAGEPTPNKPGEMWADFTQEAPDNDPMGTCIFQAHKDKVAKDSSKNYSDSNDTRSDSEKKRDAEAGLAKGFCDEVYYGKTYCSNWKKNKILIDSQDNIDIPLIERSQLVGPGDPHFSQPDAGSSGDAPIKFPGR